MVSSVQVGLPSLRLQGGLDGRLHPALGDVHGDCAAKSFDIDSEVSSISKLAASLAILRVTGPDNIEALQYRSVCSSI